ncbi:RHS repeat-associated core domain-containing protein [Lentisphaerota bacterium WC36G]|nr:RHS repeat-associated core domain-containing protein [Lentisphaerae bacterium WC36]
MALEKDGVVFNYIADGNKNITQLIDMSSGSVANRYDYSPFGQLSLDNETVANVFKFSSEFHDEKSGLIYYNYRYYNPSTGKWLSRDPIEEDGGFNLYGFVNNQPISNKDHLGQDFVAKFTIIGLGAELLLRGVDWFAKGCGKHCKKKCANCCEAALIVALGISNSAYLLKVAVCLAGGGPFALPCAALVSALFIIEQNNIRENHQNCMDKCLSKRE